MLSSTNIGVVGTHSIMGTRFSDLVARLRSDAALRGCWDAALGFDTRDSAMLGRVFMAEALAANPTGLVLFSSGNPANIAANVELATRGPDADDGRIAALRGLLPTS
jgi:hypothetical protein